MRSIYDLDDKKRAMAIVDASLSICLNVRCLVHYSIYVNILSISSEWLGLGNIMPSEIYEQISVWLGLGKLTIKSLFPNFEEPK